MALLNFTEGAGETFIKGYSLQYWLQYFRINKEDRAYYKQLCNVLGFAPGKVNLYTTALSHRSVKEHADENNERLEYLGDAVLSGIVADYLLNDIHTVAKAFSRKCEVKW